MYLFFKVFLYVFDISGITKSNKLHENKAIDDN